MEGRLIDYVSKESYYEDEEIELYNYIVEVLISDGIASNQEESAQLIEQAIDYLYESEKELVFLNNRPGVMVPDPANPGKKKWKQIDPEKQPNYPEMLSSYERRRGGQQIKQDIKTAREMEAAQKKAREDKAKADKAKAPEAKAPEAKAPEAKSPEAKAPEAKAPEAKAPEAKAPEAKSAPTTADYMKAAAAARKSGDPAEMAKVRDMGLEIWKKANPKLAAAQAERERVRGTAQTDNPLMKDFRSGMRAGAPTVQSSTLKKDVGTGYSRLTDNPNAGVAATPKSDSTAKPQEKTNKQKVTSYEGQKVKPMELQNNVSVGKPKYRD